jgi:hypothetical protein
LRGRLRLAAIPLRRQPGEDVADGGRGDEGPDEVPAAPLVLAGRALAVLVRADRDVLGAVIGRELAPAQREHRGRDRSHGRQELPRDRA